MCDIYEKPKKNKKSVNYNDHAVIVIKNQIVVK